MRTSGLELVSEAWKTYSEKEDFTGFDESISIAYHSKHCNGGFTEERLGKDGTELESSQSSSSG